MHGIFGSMHRLGSLAAACLLAGLLATPVARAQAPSADQVEAFRNLSPEQQQAILDSMGGSSQSGVRRDRDLASPETVRPRAVDGTEAARGMEDDRYTDGTGAGDARLTSGPRELRVRGRDTVLIDIAIEGLPDAPGQARTVVTPPTEDSMLREEKTTPRRLDRFTGTRTRQEIEQLEEMRERILRGNPYKLDVDGVLRIPGVQPIPLAGLTEAQATERLNLDPALRDFELSLQLLPLQKSGTEALRPFGYNLFAGSPSTFAPVTDVPVPAEYVVGPGDRLEVQLIGNTKGRHSLVVNRDGAIMFPELGPIRVSGLRFEEARARIEARVSEQMIGTQATVSLGDMRSIRVFVLGEAQRPGSYTVSGLATITNALFASGGITPIGSLRNIQLKRDGRVVTRLDLYDLLLNGDTSDNVRLLPGDVIFIPPVGSTVTVTGEIRRPAIYELAGESSAADLLYLGGGLTPQADPRLAWLERIDQRRDRAVIDVDLTDPQARGTRLQTGDVLTIPAALPTFANAVEVKGHVFRPGPQQYRNGLRLTDVLRSIDELKPNADIHYVLIRREVEGTRRVQTLSADLARAWQAPTSEANPRLAPRDQVLVFDLETGRDQYIAPIIDELKLQAVATEPSRIVRVAGQVRAEGEYPLDPGMRVSDLIRAGGGLAERAYQREAELARYEARDGQTRRAEVIKVDISRALAGDPAADLLLSPFDLLVIKEISEWSQQEAVRLEGEVRFPGEYPIARGETLRSVIERAGGLTALAFPAGSVFTRESLKEREREQIELLTARLRQDLSTLALQGAQAGGPAASQASETLSIGQTLLNDLQAVDPVGRLVIDLDKVMAAAPGSAADLILRDGDRLRIPKQMQEVTVIGEVQNATSHLYTVGLTRDDYIGRSGGATQKADEGRIYVVRANGAVQAEGSRWFRSSGGMQPGDTIVVPLDAERMRPLALWSAVTTILYNIAISVAAVNSF
jgi:protein involved in polysaccharide export with SLBB domain